MSTKSTKVTGKVIRSELAKTLKFAGTASRGAGDIQSVVSQKREALAAKQAGDTAKAEERRNRMLAARHSKTAENEVHV